MAILDKQGLQHYANKMCNADNRKVGSKSLPTALNDIDTAIDGFKTLFETEYGTPVNMELENNENVFSIGTGTNVDRRSEVENSFTDVELSGNSLVNLIQEKSYLDWHVLYCGRKSSEGIFIGRGSKYSSQASPNNITSTDVCCKIISKNNSVYTLIFDAKVIEGTSSEFTIVYNGICIRNTAKIKDGRNVILIRSDDSQNGTFQIYEVTGDNNESDINIRLTNIVILEGDWTNKPIPQYFESMKSVGQDDVNGHKIEILSAKGKPNLFKNSGFLNGFNNYNTHNGATYEIVDDNSTFSKKALKFTTGTNGTSGIYQYRIIPYIENIKYTISGWCKGEVGTTLQIHIENHKSINVNFTNEEWVRFEITSETNPTNWNRTIIFYSPNNSKVFYLKDIKAEKSDFVTPYIPHTTESHYSSFMNKKEILLNEPLRGLPNGIKDTIEKINGEWKIVRRCVQIDLNGTEYWYHENPSQEDGVNTILFATNEILNAKDFPKICDRFIAKNSNLMLSYHPDSEGVGCWSAKKNVNIRINKSRLSTIDVDGFKAWLSQNPTKVIYQLDTPIIEDISPITLQCWKNGTISIDEVLPVESTHTVALNKSAQIQKNIEELTALRNRVKALEEQYDKTALNQAYEVELLRLDMQLDNII